MLWIVLTSLVSLWFAVRAKPEVGHAGSCETFLDLDKKKLVALPDDESDSAGVLKMPKVDGAGHIANIYYKKNKYTCILRSPIDNERCTVVIWCRRNVKGRRWEPVLEVLYPVNPQPNHDQVQWPAEEAVTLTVMETADDHPAVSTKHTFIWRLDLSGGQKVRLLFDLSGMPKNPPRCIPYAYEPKEGDYYVVVKAMPDEKILGRTGIGIYNPTGDEVALYFHKMLFNPTWDRKFEFLCLVPSQGAGLHRLCIYAPNQPSEREPDLGPPATPNRDFTPSIAISTLEHFPSSDSALTPQPWVAEEGWGFAREEPQYLEVKHKKLVPLNLGTHRRWMSGLLELPNLPGSAINSMIYYYSERFDCFVIIPDDGTEEFIRSIWCAEASPGNESSKKIVDVIYSVSSSPTPRDAENTARRRPIAPHRHPSGRQPHRRPLQPPREQRTMTLHVKRVNVATKHATAAWRFDAEYGSILILQYDSEKATLIPVQINGPTERGPYLLIKAISGDRVEAIHGKSGKYQPQGNEVMIYFRIKSMLAEDTNFVCEARPSLEDIKSWICVYAPLKPSPMVPPSFDGQTVYPVGR